jgi:hypothetical protein
VGHRERWPVRGRLSPNYPEVTGLSTARKKLALDAWNGLAMTLLITIGGESAIHQSSDYRISDQGKVKETAQGTKQLSVISRGWIAQIAFTGIATDGQDYTTRDWLRDEGISLDPETGPAAFVETVARRGTEELNRVTNYDRRLTVIVAFTMVGRCRLFLLSNFEERGKNPLSTPVEALRSCEIGLSRPTLLVNGASGALQKSEKKALERMYRNNAEPKALRARLAEANRRAALRPGYGNIISQGCSVTSIFADGHCDSENYGQVPGTPSEVFPGFDMTAYLDRTLLPAIEKQLPFAPSPPALGQRTTSAPAETPETREIQVSTPTTDLLGIGQPPGSEFPRLEIGGLNSTLKLRKNVWVTAVLNTVTLEIDTSLEHSSASFALEFQRLANLPTVDGTQPRNWDYIFDLHVGGATAVLTIRKNAVALRRTNCTIGLDALGLAEELVMVAPSCELAPMVVTDSGGNTYVQELAAPAGGSLILTVTPDSPRASAEITARFLLRDFSA